MILIQFTLRKYLLVVLLAFISCEAYSQQHSDLYLKIDSVMRYELRFNVDSAEKAWVNHRGKPQLNIRDNRPVPAFPLMVLNGGIIERGELDQYTLAMVTSLQVIKREAASQFGGSGAQYGVVVIVTRKMK